MKCQVPDNLNPIQVLRRAGYGLINDRRSGQQSFVRRLGSGFYPRFHVYLEGRNINLHLDQKQASYEGYHAHSGEYDGEVVAAETARLKSVIADLAAGESAVSAAAGAAEIASEKKSFWARLFG